MFSGEPETPPAESVAPLAETTAPQGETAAGSNVAGEVAAPATATPEQTAEPAPLPETAAAPAAAATLPEPSFDIIRIEPDGQSIIAGRATPGSEWILLNNGEPIATVKADANGEWVILPDASLVPGANAFSLVPKTERGKVAIPAPGAAPQGAPADSAPSGESRSDSGIAPEAAPKTAPTAAAPSASAIEEQLGIVLPKPKPAVTPAPASLPAVLVAADGAYELQVASVRQNADAERERGRLAGAFPDLLGALDLRVQEASVEGAGTFFRVRSGAIADLGVAREICRRLEEAGQGCLVVRRSTAADADAQTEVVRDDAAPRTPPEQQAQRP